MTLAATSISSSNFQQCGNGGDGGLECTYINGVLNDTKSLYHESEVIAERFVIPGLIAGHTYEVGFDYGWEKAKSPGHMNYDFLAGWNATLGSLAIPCGDPLGNPSADIRAICNTDNTVKAGTSEDEQVVPDAVFTTHAPLQLDDDLQKAIDRFQTARGADAVRFNILGGSFPADAFTDVTYTVSGDDIVARIRVRFTPDQSTVMLLWGGHFADIRDYRLATWDADKNGSTPDAQGNLTGAAGQTGAPFQFTQQYLKDLAPGGDSIGIGSLSNNIQGSVLEPVPHASISIAPSDTNGIGESHTFTVTLLKDLDDGAGPIPAAGEHVTVTLAPTGVATVDAAASTCDDSGANTSSSGQCTLKISSTTADSITATASATLSLSGTSVTVTTDGSGDNSSPAFKIFLDGTLEWLKHDGNSTLLAGAVFTVCRLEKWDSDLNSGAGGLADITDECVDIADDISGDDTVGDRDGTGGEFKLGGLLLGKYSVKEKTAPTGYVLDPDSVVVTLSTTSDSVKIGTAFVNILPPDLKITKIPDAADDEDPDGTVHPGGTAVFTITVKNDVATGGATATGVSMTDTLPAGLSWSETPDKSQCVIDQVTFGSPSATHDRVICTIGDLAAQASFSVTLSATVPNTILQIPPSPAGTSIEIDGDLTDDPTEPGHDWASLADSLFDCTAGSRIGCDVDRPTGKTDNSFGQGTKEDTQVPKVVSGSIPNNKSDLLRFYVSRERFGSTDFLYLAWSRVQEPNGTTNMDFELNQSNVVSSNGVTPVRTKDDILVRYDLSQGGVNPQLGFHRWVISGAPATVCEASNSVPCWGKKITLTGSTVVDAAINTSPVPEPIAGGTLSARTFGEAMINLPASGIFSAGQCTVFGSAYLKSRSSDAFTSEIKDFIAPIPINITNCAPVTLNNKAWAQADGITAISDTGQIVVTEDTSASLEVTPTSVQYARKPEPMATSAM